MPTVSAQNPALGHKAVDAAAQALLKPVHVS